MNDKRDHNKDAAAGDVPPATNDRVTEPTMEKAEDTLASEAIDLGVLETEGQPTAEQIDPRDAALETLKLEVTQLKDQLVRQFAETENVRKRGQKQVEDTAKYAVGNFAKEIVGVADNLRRALDSAGKLATDIAGAAAPVLDGVALTERELLKTLEKFGIKPIEPEGQKFDPNLHQAVFEVPTAQAEPGTVVTVVQRGYTVYDRLLRPAMVGVAKAPMPDEGVNDGA